MSNQHPNACRSERLSSSSRWQRRHGWNHLAEGLSRRHDAEQQTVCAASTSPVCHWVDLRPVWVNGDTSDGLHPTESGGEHVGDLIWSEMVKDCLAQ